MSVISPNAPQVAQLKPQLAPRPPAQAQQSDQIHQKQPTPQTSVTPKLAEQKSPQAGGNGKPQAPVSTSTKTVQYQHRIDVRV
jgi:hypothetical protein